MSDFWIAGAVYSILALDHIAVGQFMVARPLVVGPILGWFWGDATLGLFAGMVVELLWVHVIPVGLWPIDTSAVTAFAVTWASLSPVPNRPALVMALCLAVPCGIAVRSIDIWTRRQNSRFVPWVSERVARGDTHSMTVALVISLLIWFLKAWLLFGIFAPLGQWTIDMVASSAPRRLMDALDWCGRLLPFLALTAVLNYFLDRLRLNWTWSNRQPTP